jgi:formate-dependent phosphoribosylglycinamide formyltransferase (GAR transformylase)
MIEKRVMVIPGGIFQMPLVKRVKELGFKVICADRLNDCPCRKDADYFINAGINEVDKLLTKAKELKPEAIITDWHSMRGTLH